MDIRSVLFIRRDNIGDLVCTTPAIRAFRLRYPGARIAVLVNSYNAEAVKGNPDIDEVFIYEKGKHSDKSRIRLALSNLGLIAKIRAAVFDASIACSYNYSKRLERYALLTGAKRRVGYVREAGKASKLFYNVQVAEPEDTVHEVEAMMGLVRPLGVEGPAPKLFIAPDREELARARAYLKRISPGFDKGLAAFQISSRKPQNRWPKERFKELGDMITRELGLKVMLLWAPGGPDNPLHPGDDDKAEWLLANMEHRPLAYRTQKLSELVAALSLSDIVVTSDGGAMHVAAALDKPILTIWGSTDKKRWSPWGVDYRLLQKDTGKAESIGSEEAFAAFKDLYGMKRVGR